jgi:toxin FitB
MNVVDSSGWLEYFADGPNAGFFAPAIENQAELIVPSISVYEVFKRVLQQRNESDARQAAAIMQQAPVIDLDADLAMHAAALSVQWGLPMADSIMLATAETRDAVLWTQDAHFRTIPGARYIEKP